MSTKRYKITVIAFDGEGETLKAEALYEQTTPILDLRKVIEAVNAEQLPLTAAPPVPRKRRKPRSDKGKKRNQTENMQ